MPTTKKPSHLAALLLALPVIAGLSACGGGGATDDRGGDTGPGADRTPAFESFEDYQLAFAECLRSRGVDVADPSDGGQSITQADEAFLDAAVACQAQIGPPPARGGQSGGDGPSEATLRDEHLEIAACLREHGVDVPDPGPGEDLAVPSDVPAEAFETCAPNGVMGSTGAQ